MIEDVQRPRMVERRRSLQLPQRQIGGGPFTYVPRRTYITEVSITSTSFSSPQPLVKVQSSFEAEPETLPVPQANPQARVGFDERRMSQSKDPQQPISAVEQPQRIETSETPLSLVKQPPFWRRHGLTMAKWLLVGAIVASAVYLGVDTYLTNAELKRRIEALSSVASSGTATPEQRQEAEGTDESTPPVDTLAKYVVSPEMPRIITIEKIGVKARVLQMGINPDGSMQAPIGIYDAGWYANSARPGTTGAAVIDAHSSGPTKLGLFGRLDELVVGDLVHVERGDGSKLRYRVINKESVEKDKVDMKKLLSVYGEGSEGLNLITCSGTWVKGQATFSNRTIVYTEKVE